jgi:hypothetical protein
MTFAEDTVLKLWPVVTLALVLLKRVFANYPACILIVWLPSLLRLSVLIGILHALYAWSPCLAAIV